MSRLGIILFTNNPLYDTVYIRKSVELLLSPILLMVEQIPLLNGKMLNIILEKKKIEYNIIHILKHYNGFEYSKLMRMCVDEFWEVCERIEWQAREERRIIAENEKTNK